ncbi:MAG: response regulator [Balneolaceae bacterium]|nr:MAG: response regulator [Balneolaceae bacterium]
MKEKKQMRILIIEDNAIQALYLETVVNKMGFNQIEKAHSYKQAVRLIDEFKPELLFVDINLDEESTGIDVVNTLNGNHDVQVIYVTGNSDRYYTKQIENTNYLGYLVKPFNLNELRDLLTSVNILNQQ